MADTHDDRKPSERREPKKPTLLAQGDDDDDDYFSRPHNEATHGEDPAVAQQLGDV